MDEIASPKQSFLKLVVPDFRSLSYWLQVLGIALVYIAAAKVGLSFATVHIRCQVPGRLFVHQDYQKCDEIFSLVMFQLVEL